MGEMESEEQLHGINAYALAFDLEGEPILIQGQSNTL